MVTQGHWVGVPLPSGQEVLEKGQDGLLALGGGGEERTPPWTNLWHPSLGCLKASRKKGWGAGRDTVCVGGWLGPDLLHQRDSRDRTRSETTG